MQLLEQALLRLHAPFNGGEDAALVLLLESLVDVREIPNQLNACVLGYTSLPFELLGDIDNPLVRFEHGEIVEMKCRFSRRQARRSLSR